MVIMVCVGSSCHLKGAEEVINIFQNLIQKEKVHRRVELKGSFCLEKCSDTGVTVKLDDDFRKITPEETSKFFYDEIMPRLAW